MATKGQAETYDKTKQIIADIEGASLGGISYEQRVKRFHTDMGSEWVNSVVRERHEGDEHSSYDHTRI